MQVVVCALYSCTCYIILCYNINTCNKFFLLLFNNSRVRTWLPSKKVRFQEFNFLNFTLNKNYFSLFCEEIHYTEVKWLIDKEMNACQSIESFQIRCKTWISKNTCYWSLLIESGDFILKVYWLELFFDQILEYQIQYQIIIDISTTFVIVISLSKYCLFLFFVKLSNSW